MNIIVIVSDTFRYDYVGANGNTWIKTPELDAFSRRSINFDNCYVSSFPTVPMRTDAFTGKYSFPYYGWQPLSDSETVIAEVLGVNGYVNQIIADTPHMMKEKMFLHRGFHGSYWIRGQEGDVYLTRMNHKIEQIMPPEKTRLIPMPFGAPLVDLHHWLHRDWRWEEDRYMVQTCRTASRWLEDNYKAEKFFLWLDCFDVHEPWDAPEYLVDMYDPDYDGPPMKHPHYGPATDYTKAEIKNLRAHYSAEVTLVSKWIGHVLRKIEDLGLFDNTVVVFTADHGTYLGEHNRTGKSNLCAHDDRGPWPMYREVAQMPLMISVPGAKGGKRIKELVQPPDFMPTLLDLAGCKIPSSCHGESMVPLLKGQKGKWNRKYAFSSGALNANPAYMNEKSTVTSKTYSLILGGKRSQKPELYHLPTDPRQKKNIAKQKPEMVKRIRNDYIKWLRKMGTEESKVQSLMERKS